MSVGLSDSASVPGLVHSATRPASRAGQSRVAAVGMTKSRRVRCETVGGRVRLMGERMGVCLKHRRSRMTKKFVLLAMAGSLAVGTTLRADGRAPNGPSEDGTLPALTKIAGQGQ